MVECCGHCFVDSVMRTHGLYNLVVDEHSILHLRYYGHYYRIALHDIASGIRGAGRGDCNGSGSLLWVLGPSGRPFHPKFFLFFRTSYGVLYTPITHLIVPIFPSRRSQRRGPQRGCVSRSVGLTFSWVGPLPGWNDSLFRSFPTAASTTGKC